MKEENNVLGNPSSDEKKDSYLRAIREAIARQLASLDNVDKD